MRIGVVGLGYVGIVTAVVLADHGNHVIGINRNRQKSEQLAKGIPPLHEPQLKELLNKNLRNFTFSTDYESLKDAEMVFLIVPTPTVKGKIDLSYITEASMKVSEVNKNAILVIKSTVVPGTAKMIAGRTGMVVVSNPEFTKEGSGVDDTAHPNRIIIGASDKQAGDAVESVWAFTKAPVLRTNNENAELIKYASNSFLAAKISFINEIANLCEKLPGCDVEVVAKGMGLDERIAPYFLKAGLGFGGSCFPKDTKALASFAKEKGERMSIVEAAIKVNSNRIDHVIAQAKEAAGRDLSGIRVGVLGATFKEGTDDLRESQALKLIQKLKKMGAAVTVYDPITKAIPIKGVGMAETKEKCIEGSDIVIVATEWKDFSDAGKYAGSRPIIDARRIAGQSGNIRSVGLGK